MVPVVPAVPAIPLVPSVLFLWGLNCIFLKKFYGSSGSSSSNSSIGSRGSVSLKFKFFYFISEFFYGSSGSSISISFTGSSNSNFSRLKNFYWWFWQFQLSKAFKFLWLNLFVFFVIYVECCYIVNLLTIIWITLTQGLNTQKNCRRVPKFHSSDMHSIVEGKICFPLFRAWSKRSFYFSQPKTKPKNYP